MSEHERVKNFEDPRDRLIAELNAIRLSRGNRTTECLESLLRYIGDEKVTTAVAGATELAF